ncbi:glycoside hydrolase [Enterococcus faecalis]|uniref:glycoside hydrolase n=1 Tax=Enterococcus faecalis TaxID=1351 RepID=UPI002DBDF61B|nr:glycoside hydrolase [Enterococcus faecalis]MEB8383843.1 glycoside hydrolase [Enterococcus faecalis]
MNNKKKRKQIVAGVLGALVLSATALCFAIQQDASSNQKKNDQEKKYELIQANKKYQMNDLQFQLDPETFELTMKSNGKSFSFTGNEKEEISDYKEEKDKVSWTYPKKGISVTVHNKNDHLSIELLTLDGQTKDFSFLNVKGNNYYLPIGEGKSIPADDQNWQKYFKEEKKLDLNEAFSMAFYSASQGDTTATVVMENNFRKQLTIDEANDKLALGLNTTINQYNQKKAIKYDIYLTESDPVAVAKTYQSNRIENGQFELFSEKQKKNPQLEKLVGAQHIYFWQSRIITDKDINWQKLQKQKNDEFYEHVGSLVDKYTEDGREEYDQAITALKNGEAYKAEKNTILTALNNALSYPDFYNEDLAPSLSEEEKKYLEETKEEMPTEKRYSINKKIMKAILKDALGEMKQWGQETSTEVIKNMKNSGLNKAWLGLANWNQGLINPEFVKESEKDGYLVGPYDSYQSIHENPSYEWNTAGFKNNAEVYKNKTIMNESGEYVAGFLGKGRKVNQTMIDDELDYRIQNILTENIPFNSWFLDTDAAGEIYDDFHPEHLTSMEEDIAARLDRAAKLTEKGQVIGTETGNDYFNKGMDFAHGLETPVIWGDEEMRNDKESPYYLGSYGTMNDGIPDRYGKQVPLKEEYIATTIDPVYSIPLYKLVYNQSVITSHHWEWDSNKIKGEEANRRIREYLYNSPALFHLNAETWEKRKSDILGNGINWEIFQSLAINEEMTAFNYLTKNKLVQSTTYGKDLMVIANFSDQEYITKDNKKIQPHTALILKKQKELLTIN